VGRVDAAPRVLTEPAPRGDRVASGPDPEQCWERFGAGETLVVWIQGAFWKRKYDLGHSAGAHLALWTGVPAVAPAPVAELPEARRLRLGDDALARCFAPVTSPETLPKTAHQILVHGTADEIVPSSVSERHSGRLIRLEGTGDYEPISPWSAEWPLAVRTIEELL
jgi:hypothetical protein